MAHAPAHDTPSENPLTASEGNVALAFVAALCIAGFGVLLSGISREKAAQAKAPAPARVDGVSSASGAQEAVATAAPEATEAALEVLAEGGNAFDALVSASFVVSVVRPQSTGIGGGGFVLFYESSHDDAGCYDGREAAPAAATPDMYLDAAGNLNESTYRYGPLSAGTPGLVALLWEVHQKHGSGALVSRYGSKQAAWKRLLQPAIRYARDGFKVSRGLAATIAARASVLSGYPKSAAVFLPGGKAPKADSILRQPGLANTLETIAVNGARGFYEGPIASALVNSSREAGGVLTLADLSGYEVKRREYVDATYRGRRVLSFPLPSSGGTILVEMLHMLEGYDLAALRHNSPEHVHLLAEVMRRAYADRNALLADPDSLSAEQKTKIALLLEPDYAQALAATIDLERATPSRQIGGGALLPESDHTTHISIVDRDGNAVASTQTINTGLGSCFVAGETGVLLNNEMNDFTGKVGAANAFGAVQSERNLPGANKRPLSSMCPTIVFDRDRRVQAVLGTPGGTKIITTVLQLTSNIVDFGLAPEAAISAARMHHQHLPDQVTLEAPLAGIRGELLGRGHQVEVLPPSAGICDAQIVVKTAAGWTAVSDPRGTGRAGAR